MTHAGNQSMVKKNNQKAIVKYLMHNGATSRADLAKILEVSKPTISKNTNELIEENILIEEGKGDNELGKKSILVNFNKDFKYVLGIDISKRRFKITLGDLLCNVKYTLDIEYNHPDDIDCLAFIEDFLHNNNIVKSDIYCIGISYPGIISNGTFPNILSEKVNQIKLKKLTNAIEKAFDAKTIIKNDINLAVIGERIITGLLDIDNLLYISVDVGIGAGLIINGKLYEGDRKGAGEIGFTIPNIQADGNYVNIEEVASKTGIIKIIKKDFNKINQSILYKLCNGNIDNISMRNFAIALKQGDTYCQQLIEKVSMYLGITIANITSLLDIENVIISGDIPNLHESVINKINEVVSQLVPFHTSVNIARGKESSLIGAVNIAIEITINDILD
ncbi:transcriptional regulator [Vallitalea longa]|uniref:Transcriptional regulator n=1 Tax=Vallitalea longa TaxID=2936439 RepID=A0A9W5YCQ0_9FIRM|nr:ROK family transcriptional regulator [Vallitalea longa]GKX31567.1 transcriptional regulator [Vallitalea longa]